MSSSGQFMVACGDDVNASNTGIYTTSIPTNIGSDLWVKGNLYANNSSTPKTFVIDHPIYESKYLVHGCLEGPEAGVYYRGINEIINDKFAIIKLPDYVSLLASNFTVQITDIYNEETNVTNVYSASRVKNNLFTVYGKNGSFYWTVYGERIQIETEPNKSDVIVNGDGPYKWI